jgi:PP-loop superfamily ATP-utilizing enzyme
MPERFSEMEKACVAQQNEGKPRAEEIRPAEREFLRRVKEYPELKAKIETMLAIIENAGGDIEKAAEAERRIIEELRQMGNEVLHGWARRQQEKKEEEYNAKPGVNRKEKKSSTGTHDWEKSK